MSDFLVTLKQIIREAMADTLSKTEEQRINQAFRNGIALGLLLGCGLASFGWIAFFWLASLAK